MGGGIALWDCPTFGGSPGNGTNWEVWEVWQVWEHVGRLASPPPLQLPAFTEGGLGARLGRDGDVASTGSRGGTALRGVGWWTEWTLWTQFPHERDC